MSPSISLQTSVWRVALLCSFDSREFRMFQRLRASPPAFWRGSAIIYHPSSSSWVAATYDDVLWIPLLLVECHIKQRAPSVVIAAGHSLHRQGHQLLLYVHHAPARPSQPHGLAVSHSHAACMRTGGGGREIAFGCMPRQPVMWLKQKSELKKRDHIASLPRAEHGGWSIIKWHE
jgi:hypothetical protein